MGGNKLMRNRIISTINNTLSNMKHEVQNDVVESLSSKEVEHIHSLVKRMSYTYEILFSEKINTFPISKFIQIKSEFRAIEWSLYMFGIIPNNGRPNKTPVPKVRDVYRSDLCDAFFAHRKRS